MSVFRYRILKNYMEEDGFLCGPSYVVWLHGCTDGWPQAIFTSKKAAEEWVKTIPLNPEGFRIEEINFRKLCEEIAEAADEIERLTVSNVALAEKVKTLEKALRIALPYVEAQVNDDGGIDNCEIGDRLAYERARKALGGKP